MKEVKYVASVVVKIEQNKKGERCRIVDQEERKSLEEIKRIAKIKCREYEKNSEIYMIVGSDIVLLGKYVYIEKRKCTRLYRVKRNKIMDYIDTGCFYCSENFLKEYNKIGEKW